VSRLWSSQATCSTFDPSEVQELLDYAAQELNNSGIKDKLLSVWRQTGVKPIELDNLADCPDSLLYVWIYFMRLHNQRQVGMSVNALSFSDIQAFFMLEQVHPLSEEVSIICRLDAIALKAHSDQSKAESKNNTPKK
jgi:hypothetical protein